MPKQTILKQLAGPVQAAGQMEPQDGRTSGSTTGQAPPQAQAHRDASPRPSAPASESPVFASAIPVSGSHQHHQQPQPQQAGGPPTPAAVGNLPAIPSDPSAKEQQAAAKQSLKQWWTKFTKQQQQQQSGYPKKDGTSPTSSGKGVFGVPLTESLKYAGVAISMVGPDGINQVYGYVIHLLMHKQMPVQREGSYDRTISHV